MAVTSPSSPGIQHTDAGHMAPPQEGGVESPRGVATLIEHDGFFLIRQPDFYAVMALITLPPIVAPTTFDREKPFLSVRWRQSETARDIFAPGSVIGNALVPFGLSGLTYVYGRSSHHLEVARFGRDLFRAEVMNSVLTLGLKYAFNRTRPNGGAYSYPSGHASVAFTAAGVTHAHFGTVWGAVAYVGAAYVGFSRMQENKHYLTDVIAGAILGSYLGERLARRSLTTGSMALIPVVTSHGGVIRLVRRF